MHDQQQSDGMTLTFHDTSIRFCFDRKFEKIEPPGSILKRTFVIRRFFHSLDMRRCTLDGLRRRRWFCMRLISARNRPSPLCQGHTLQPRRLTTFAQAFRVSTRPDIDLALRSFDIPLSRRLIGSSLTTLGHRGDFSIDCF